jgi:hypothetical protein
MRRGRRRSPCWPPDRTKANMRANRWDKMKDWLLHGAIETDEKMAMDLAGPEYHINRSNLLVLESKYDMQKRGQASPVDGDALALTFAQPVEPAEVAMTPTGGSQSVAAMIGGLDGERAFRIAMPTLQLVETAAGLLDRRPKSGQHGTLRGMDAVRAPLLEIPIDIENQMTQLGRECGHCSAGPRRHQRRVPRDRSVTGVQRRGKGFGPVPPQCQKA